MDRERYRVRTLHRVILAGLGALVKAREGGEDLFRELVKKGEELEAQSNAGLTTEEDLSGSDLATEGREILAYAGVLENLVYERRRFERMVEAMMPDTPLPTPPVVLQARRNAAAREALLSEFGVLGSTAIASLAGSRAKNKASLANRWKQEGRIFSVPHHGAAYFPAYQFDEKGQPLPVIARVLSTLGRESKEWELALWFMAANGWLDGQRPVDLLRTEPEEVGVAAEREAEGLLF